VSEVQHAEPVLWCDQEAATPARRRTHRAMLAISLGVLVLSPLLVILPDQRVALWFLPNWPAPDSCLSRTALGIPCPGCGLTRSFISLAHGEFTRSWNYHRMGWALALLTVAQVPYRFFALRHRMGAPLGHIFPRVLSSLVIVMLVLNWIWSRQQ
jgi:Protein of unknown function (DUF2752)